MRHATAHPNPTHPRAQADHNADPRTLIVSWHWPPTNRASSGVLGTLFSAAPPGRFRVITRAFPNTPETDRREATPDFHRRVPATTVRWPLDDQMQPTLRHWPTVVRTVLAMVRTACRVGRDWPAERVLAVYPHRMSLLAGALTARRLNVPLVLYMHDLCIEAMTIKNPIRRLWWKTVDGICLQRADLVVVPTEEFAEHYRKRSVHPCWVLPHCAPDRSPLPTPSRASDKLSLLYTGGVYEPHDGAARAFIKATRSMTNVRITYLTDPRACGGLLAEVGARWVSQPQSLEAVASADVGVVLLSSIAPCPEEVHGCFPSKILDYLIQGRPILAVVPEGCFVDRLITNAHCGVVVRRHDTATIRKAIDLLRDPRVREDMGTASRRLLTDLQKENWMPRFLDHLRAIPHHQAPQPAPKNTPSPAPDTLTCLSAPVAPD